MHFFCVFLSSTAVFWISQNQVFFFIPSFEKNKIIGKTCLDDAELLIWVMYVAVGIALDLWKSLFYKLIDRLIDDVRIQYGVIQSQ